MNDIVLVVIVIAVFGILLVREAWVTYPRKRKKRKAKGTINYTPRGDRVIVKQLARAAQAADQVFIPDSQQKPYNEGTVIEVGPDVPDLAAGDHVCFVDFAGTAVEIDGVEYLSMREVEIHGKRG